VSEPATILPLPLTEEEEKLAKLIAEILVSYVLEKTTTYDNSKIK
jgi:hypothetical protein